MRPRSQRRSTARRWCLRATRPTASTVSMVYAQREPEQLDSLFGRLTEAGLEPLGVDVVDDRRDPVRELLRIGKLGALEVIAAVDGLVARLVDELGVAAGDHPAVVAVDVLVCPAAGGRGGSVILKRMYVF